MQYGIAFTPLVPTLVLWLALGAIVVVAGILWWLMQEPVPGASDSAPRLASETPGGTHRVLVIAAPGTASVEVAPSATDIVVVVPGALNAGLGDAKFWWSIVIGFAIAFGPAWAANRWLIARGKGHAVMHEYHQGHAGHATTDVPERPR